VYDTRDCLVSTRISTFAGIRRIAEKTDSVVRYYHLDHLGSTRLITDSLGNIVAEYKYYLYGANIAQNIQAQVLMELPIGLLAKEIVRTLGCITSVPGSMTLRWVGLLHLTPLGMG
jgi:hypothetical protein